MIIHAKIDKHMGPRWVYAGITVDFTLLLGMDWTGHDKISTQLVDNLDISDPQTQKYIAAALQGIQEGLNNARLAGVKAILLDLSISQMNSSENTFQAVGIQSVKLFKEYYDSSMEVEG